MDDLSTNNNPWINAEERYQPGQQIQGTVTRMAQFGVFVQVEPEMEGIIYTFELGHGPSAMTGIAPGQKLHLYVKSIDPGKKRLELSLQNQPVPGLPGEGSVPFQERKNRHSGIPWSAPFPLPDLPVGSDERCCSGCQKTIQVTWKYCIYCGYSLRRHCPACGSEQPDLPDGRYCCECGKPLQ